MNQYGALENLPLPLDRLKNKSILVTGANGMIASAFVEAVLELSRTHKLGTVVYALCRSQERGSKRFADYMGDEDFKLIAQDVIVPLDDSYEFDYIVHAASAANPTAFNTTPVDVMNANYIGTMNMLDYTKSHPSCRFLFVSSSEVYGENEERIPIFTEDIPGSINFTRARACYPSSKRAAETLTLCYKEQFGSDVVIVRPAYIYGKDIIDSNNRADVYFLRQAINHEDIVMFSEGSQIRSYCYVTDCISGMLFAMLSGENGGIYNIGNEDCIVTLKEYAQMCADVGGVELVMKVEKKPEGMTFLHTTQLILDTTRLRALGWKPQFTLEDGFKDIFEALEGKK